jgi:hypothetical protein
MKVRYKDIVRLERDICPCHFMGVAHKVRMCINSRLLGNKNGIRDGEQFRLS